MAIFKRKTAKPAADEVVKTDAVVEAPKESKKAPAKSKKKTEDKRDVVKAQTGLVSVLAAKTMLAPLVSEKSAHLSDAGVYTFRVPLTANRVAVRKAFKELYNVSPVSVNMIRVHGKESRFGAVSSRASDFKKALVTVPTGTRVDIFTL
jgi:large subunit ribosomal protein L23